MLHFFDVKFNTFDHFIYGDIMSGKITPVINSISECEEYCDSLPVVERGNFKKWWVAYQDIVSYEDYKKSGFKHVVDVVEEVHEHLKKIHEKPEQLKLAFMPTRIARTSPFFPMSRSEMKSRPLYKDFKIVNRWGTITVSGPKLSIQDETVLLAVLLLAKQYKTDRFSTNYAELCGVMGVKRGSTQYVSLSECLKRLTKTVVDTEIYSSQKGEQKKVIESITGAILSNVVQKPKSTTVEIFLNPYFLALYGVNLTTGIDLDKRAKLKGDVSKALYRFLETHSGGGVPYGLLTICNAINLNVDQPVFEIRKILRKALAELQRQGNIKKWRLDKNDLVHIHR